MLTDTENLYRSLKLLLVTSVP